MWKVKYFKTHEDLVAWIVRKCPLYQIEEIFVNNRWAVRYRRLRRIG